jgi:hypothetical protein
MEILDENIWGFAHIPFINSQLNLKNNCEMDVCLKKITT